MEYKGNFLQHQKEDPEQRLRERGSSYMCLLLCLPLDKEKLTVFIVGQFQKYLSGTCYVQSETRAKPELNVEFSHNSMQNGLARRWLGGSEDKWPVGCSRRRQWSGSTWKAAGDLSTGRAGR